MKFTRKIISIILALATIFPTLALAGCNNSGSKEPMVDDVDHNNRTFYQIFVGSFSDSNGDTFGDLRGIINRMDYLNDGDINNGNDLGIQGIWLSPILTSPSYHKYDVKNYYEVDPEFGTMDDLKELIALCHERNVKVIIDLVINHTSSQNQWFMEFKDARTNGKTDSPYYDYYTCVTLDEKESGKTYQNIGMSDFWYECNFSGAMPELNFDNHEVRELTLEIAKFYLDMGIDGFRFDAVKYIYFGDAKRSVDFWKWYMGELQAYKPDIYCVGECWSGENEILEYYEALNCFNFGIGGAEGVVARTAKGSDVSVFTSYVERYQDVVQEANSNGVPISFLSNHDQDRIAGTFIDSNYMKMAASLYLLSPGSPFIYYGEEIGIKGSRGSASTDANRRLAMLWGDGDTIKNPVGSNYKDSRQIDTTVKSQLEDDKSMLNHYTALIAIRNRYDAISCGDYNAVTHESTSFGGFYVEYKDEILGIFHNTGAEDLVIDLSECEGLDGHSFSSLLESLGGKARLKGTTLKIPAYTSVILK